MIAAFKVKICKDNGDLIRTIFLKIPMPTSEYTANATIPGNYYDTGSFAAAVDTGLAYHGGDLVNCTYFMYSQTKKQMMLQLGFTGEQIALENDPNAPIRIVFDNGSYIRITANNIIGLGFEYKLESGVQVGYFQSQSRLDPCSLYFPMFNSDGVVTNVRCRRAYLSLPSAGDPAIYGAGQQYDSTSLDLWLAGLIPADIDDPYINIPSSTPSGPAEGIGLPASDEVDIPSLPTFSVTDTGFVTLFNPTMTQVKNLADYMWNGLFDINNFKKIFADPMDCILGFNMVPVAVPSGAAANINIGNIVTSVTMNVATSQWVEVDCGSIDIGLPYGSYLDFSPYTKFSIYLPYIGTCELSADDVAGKALTLKYHVDALSCACVAYLKCGNHVLYQWTGSCGYSIPVTQNDFSRMIMGMISVAAAGIGGAVVGGASAAIVNAGASAAKNVSGLKPEVHRSGAIGSSAGLMGGQVPYLIIEIPQACKPERQYHYTGYPGFITVKVGDLTGYAEFEEIILSGIGCTEEERGMIESLCKGGIYV